MTPIELYSIFKWIKAQRPIEPYVSWMKQMGGIDAFKENQYMFCYYLALLNDPVVTTRFNERESFKNILRKIGWDTSKFKVG